MKHYRYVFRNLFRNPVRSALTILLTGAIFFFVATLLSILANFEQAENSGEGQNRLGIQSAVSLGNMLPIAYEQRIEKVPGVKVVGKLQWLGAYYRDQKNFFANFAVDHEKMAMLWDDYATPPDQMEAFKANRQAALVGPEIAKRFGWKVGDRITLTGTIFPFNPELTIVGIYDHKIDDSSLFMRMDYFRQAMDDLGQVGMFWVKVDPAADMTQVSDEIDALFANSEAPTETVTEKEFQRQFISMIGNIKLLFTVVSVCAIFMVVLLAAIAMSMSARERVTEIAVLKAIGFPRGLVLTLMLVEFVFLALLGGVVGALGAKLIFKFVDMTAATQGFLLNFGVNGETLTICLVAAALVGLLAGGLPALRASNIPVVDGLRKVV